MYGGRYSVRMAAPQSDPQTPAADPQEEISGVLALLLVGAALTPTAQSIANLLKLPIGPVLLVMHMMKRDSSANRGTTLRHNINVPTVSTRPTPSQLVTDANNHYRAAFLINSSRRVDAAPDAQAQMKQEQSYWSAHVQASNRRVYSAMMAEDELKLHGPVLGWYAVLDARTSDDCRAMHGSNFYAFSPPDGLWPGATHLFCRCKPGPPFEGGKIRSTMAGIREGF